MGLFRRRRDADETQPMEVPVLGYPRDGWSWKVDRLDGNAVGRAVAELAIDLPEEGGMTSEDDTLVVLQRMKSGQVVVTLGSEVLGQVPSVELERVRDRVRRVGSLAAVPARIYRYTSNRWTVVVFA